MNPTVKHDMCAPCAELTVLHAWLTRRAWEWQLTHFGTWKCKGHVMHYEGIYVDVIILAKIHTGRMLCLITGSATENCAHYFVSLGVSKYRTRIESTGRWTVGQMPVRCLRTDTQPLLPPWSAALCTGSTVLLCSALLCLQLNDVTG